MYILQVLVQLEPPQHNFTADLNVKEVIQKVQINVMFTLDGLGLCS